MKRFGVAIYSKHSAWFDITQLDCHVHLDLWVRGVAIDEKIFKFNVLDAVPSDDLEGGEGAELTSKLKGR